MAPALKFRPCHLWKASDALIEEKILEQMGFPVLRTNGLTDNVFIHLLSVLLLGFFGGRGKADYLSFKS